MSTSENKEDRAWEGLIVSRLREARSEERDHSKPPFLTDEDKAALKCLKPGFIENLIEQLNKEADLTEEPSFDEEPCHSPELVGGLNRADNVDEAAEAELSRQREEMLKKLREEANEKRDRSDG